MLALAPCLAHQEEEEGVYLEDLAQVRLEADHHLALVACLVAPQLLAQAEAACSGGLAALITQVEVCLVAVQISPATQEDCSHPAPAINSHRVQCLEELPHLEDNQPQAIRTQCLEEDSQHPSPSLVGHLDRRPLCLVEQSATLSHLPREYLEDHPRQEEALLCLEEVTPLSHLKDPQSLELAAALARPL